MAEVEKVIEGFTPVEGVFPVLMCPGCLADRARGRGPYPDLTDAELRAGLDLLPTWALAQKAAANRQVIAIMGGRLERRHLVGPPQRQLATDADVQRPGELFLSRADEHREGPLRSVPGNAVLDAEEAQR